MTFLLSVSFFVCQSALYACLCICESTVSMYVCVPASMYPDTQVKFDYQPVCVIFIVENFNVVKRGVHRNFKKGGKSRRGGIIEEGGPEIPLHTMVMQKRFLVLKL